MGIFDGIEVVLMGIISLIIVASFIATSWPTLAPIIGNEIFSMGTITLFLIALIPTVFTIALISKIWKKVSGDREGPNYPQYPAQ